MSLFNANTIIRIIMTWAVLSQISCGVKGPPLPPLAIIPQKTETQSSPTPTPTQTNLEPMPSRTNSQ